MVVEVMGRYAGWIALHAGIAGAADVILIPEIPYDIAPGRPRRSRDRSAPAVFSIVVVAEGGGRGPGTDPAQARSVGTVERLGRGWASR